MFLSLDWCFILSGLQWECLGFFHPTPTVEFCLLQLLIPGCSVKWLSWAPHSLALVKLVRDVENTKKTTWFRVLEHPLRQGEARTVYIVERGTGMTGLPAKEERAKKWYQIKLFGLNSLLSSEVNCILHVWLLMGWGFFLYNFFKEAYNTTAKETLIFSCVFHSIEQCSIDT